MEEQADRRNVAAGVLDSAPDQGEAAFDRTAAVWYRRKYREPEHERQRRFLVAPDRFGISRDLLAKIGRVGAAPDRKTAWAIEPAAGKGFTESGLEVGATGEERIRVGKIRVQCEGKI